MELVVILAVLIITAIWLSVVTGRVHDYVRYHSFNKDDIEKSHK